MSSPSLCPDVGDRGLSSSGKQGSIYSWRLIGYTFLLHTFISVFPRPPEYKKNKRYFGMSIFWSESSPASITRRVEGNRQTGMDDDRAEFRVVLIIPSKLWLEDKRICDRFHQYIYWQATTMNHSSKSESLRYFIYLQTQTLVDGNTRGTCNFVGNKLVTLPAHDLQISASKAHWIGVAWSHQTRSFVTPTVSLINTRTTIYWPQKRKKRSALTCKLRWIGK